MQNSIKNYSLKNANLTIYQALVVEASLEITFKKMNPNEKDQDSFNKDLIHKNDDTGSKNHETRLIKFRFYSQKRAKFARNLHYIILRKNPEKKPFDLEEGQLIK